MKNLLIIIVSFLCFTACESKKDYEINSSKNYEKSKISLQETEQKSPSNFITAQGDQKRNFVGQTVIKGTVTNNAKMVTFKDIDVKISFYSKTGTLLEEDHETIYEMVLPGTTKKFKSKYFTPKGTDSVGFKVMSAKF